MSRSLVTLTLLAVGGVVLIGGALLVAWVASADREAAQAQAREEQEAAGDALRALAADLVDQSEVLAIGLSESAQRRLRTWLEQEPLALYRAADDPTRVDVEALGRDLVARVRAAGREENDRIHVLAERLAQDGERRIAAALERMATRSAARSEAGVDTRQRRLLLHMGLLLLALAGLVALLLVWVVVRPLRETQAAVDRIARGDLRRPVTPPRRAPREITRLAEDVERMRTRIAQLTAGLEQEVAQKTTKLQATLAERTAALDELRRTRDRLVQSAKMAGLGTLAGGVAHEFNNLLGGILGCLESAKSELEPGRAHEDLAVAERTAQRASILVRALLDVARPGERAFAAVDLDELAGDVARAAEPSARREGVDLVLHAGHVPAVLGDAGQLHQVVLNLVTNALQAAGRGGHVRLSTARVDGRVELVVEDDGPGVPPELVDRIFEPFYTTRDGGTGLGLFISYGIVERHGGTLAVDRGPLGGARFRLTLPAAGD
ncbi:MAG: HAMP domain-containing protein [Planctomycetes bacterium]|nr:HAMP domain-containing protein [Planctomycetota bacterium]MCB9830722.1 HAMP domain-containing protein [Planctomycetota bacterium]MCB9902323.1 HAMP domain-containing protein [Planctomycetota bacterium]